MTILYLMKIDAKDLQNNEHFFVYEQFHRTLMDFVHYQ